MPTHKNKSEFLQRVITQVKFPFDKKEIYTELDNHIEDRANDFLEEGYTHEDSILKSIDIMGDPTVLGKELNKIHNPIIGWIWKISDILMKVLILLVIFNLAINIIPMFDNYSPIDELNSDELVYKYEFDEKAIIDNRVINITDIAYDTSGNLYIEFKTYSNSIFTNVWSFGNIGTITDEFGNVYFGGSNSSGGYFSKSYITIENFPMNSRTLNIVYDQFNRHYEFHFNLETGEAYE